MITGVHAIMFTSEPVAVREFFRDVLELPWVDAGYGWLIFALPPAELAAHPVDEGADHHELYLMCDDLQATVERLEKRGVLFTRAITDSGWGLTTAMALPDGGELALYEPRHPTPRSELRGR